MLYIYHCVIESEGIRLISITVQVISPWGGCDWCCLHSREHGARVRLGLCSLPWSHSVLESYFFVLGHTEFIFLICLTFHVSFYGILFLPIPVLVFLSDYNLFLLLLFFTSTNQIPQSNFRVCEKLTSKTAIIVDCSTLCSLVYIWGICFENLRFIYFLLYTYECFACMYIYTSHECLVPAEAIELLWTCSYRWLCPPCEH